MIKNINKFFDSHEGFTRAFSKQFGMTPKYYRKNTPPLNLFMPSHIRDYYLMIQKAMFNKGVDIGVILMEPIYGLVHI